MVKKEIIEEILRFREARDWKQFHSPKNLSEAIVIEASELLEVFQWIENSSSEKFAIENREKVEDEVADIMIYILYMCNDLEINLEKTISNKIQKNQERFPQDRIKGKSNNKYTDKK